MRKCDNAAVGGKLTRHESSARGCIVIMEQPIARATPFRSFCRMSSLRRTPSLFSKCKYFNCNKSNNTWTLRSIIVPMCCSCWVINNMNFSHSENNQRPLSKSFLIFLEYAVNLYNDQRNAQVFNVFINLLLPYMFRAFVYPIFRGRCTVSAVVQVCWVWCQLPGADAIC
jgi:hypothetical protein